MFPERMKSRVPDPLKAALKPAYRGLVDVYDAVRGSLLDAIDAAAGRRHPLTPPRRLWWLVTHRGAPDFRQSGAEVRALLVENGLQPTHRVLDVGCGLGRLAAALAEYLTEEGSYEGFDIMPAAIGWCRHIEARHPNFRFQLVDVQSDRYRPDGRRAASRFEFPYPDASFDFVVLTSVFTHMLPDDMRNYLAEIARVLRPGGRCLITYFLMTPERRKAVETGASALTFRHAGEGYWAELADLPEAALAYDEAEILALFESHDLQVLSRAEGRWHLTQTQSQDQLVAQRR